MSEFSEEASESLLEDIRPVIHNSYIPSELAKLRRCPDVQFNNERRRVYRDPQGNIIEIDPALFSSEQGNENSSDSIGNPFDDEALSRIDRQMHMERGIKAANVVAIADATRRKTPGTRRLSTVLNNMQMTYDDIQKAFQNDFEGLRFVPVVSPMINAMSEFAGASPMDTNDCYGCTRGVGIERVTHEKIEALRQIIIELYFKTHAGLACRMIELWFEEHIRQPTNKQLHPGMQPIGPWPAAMIYQHVEWHMKESSFIRNRMVQNVVELCDIICMRELYRVPAECIRPGSKITPADYRVSPAGAKLLFDAIKTMKTLIDWKVEASSNSIPKLNIATRTTPNIISEKEKPPTFKKTKSIFSTAENNF